MPRLMSKVFKWSDLMSDPVVIITRLNAIRDATAYMNTPCWFERQDEHTLIQHSVRIPTQARHVQHLNDKQAQNLRTQLKHAHDLHLIHGDLHPKNMKVLGDQVYIFDWEPDHYQWINHKLSWRYTRPWVHPDDVKTGVLSQKTDELCCLKMCHAYSYQQALVAMS